MKLQTIEFYLIFNIFLRVHSYKILVFYPLPIRSTNLLGEGIVRHLLGAGHEVTYATVYPIKKDNQARLRQIDLSKNKEMIEGDPTLSISHILTEGQPTDGTWYHQEFGLIVANMTFENENILKFLSDDNEQFDAVVADFYETEVYSGLSSLYNCPMIWMYSIGVDWIATRLIDAPTNPAYTVDYSSINQIPLNFIQRTQELWTQIHWYYLKTLYSMPEEEKIYNTVLKPLIKRRGQAAPAYKEVIYNVSLILGNDYNIAGLIPQLPQNYKLIGGQHIRTPVQALPQNLQTIMDEAKYGVIYFSMGSTWQSKNIPNTLKKELLQVFSELKQTVIWKYEEDLSNLPQNVHIVKWAPQHSILAHPKCSVFITHGGQLSSSEAIHFGIPLIGIPIWFDQFRNINKAVSLGYAIKVDLNYDLPKNLRNALNIILNEKSYALRAKEISAIYHDRPVPPGKELVHWVEHVIRTRGAPHLRSPALTVAWYQKIYLDLLFTVSIVLAIVFKNVQRYIQPKRTTRLNKNKRD